MKKVLKTEEERIAYNCRKATFLIEKKQDIELTARERMELQLHLAGCYICRVYEEQSILINRLMKNAFKNPSNDIRLDESFKEQLKQIIENKMGNN